MLGCFRVSAIHDKVNTRANVSDRTNLRLEISLGRSVIVALLPLGILIRFSAMSVPLQIPR